MSDDHVHEWFMDPLSPVIDTMPPLYTYECRGCDAVTHDPETGKPCPIKHYR